MTDSPKNKQAFNAEIKQLLDLVVHSLYSQKEIFLRELISNASDALDKLKFESLTRPELIPDDQKLEIRLVADKENNSLSVVDSGIGMSPEEVTQFIGTIAKSGTKSFAQKTKEMQARPELIGQFGVGFYSAFMVADQVILHTQKAGEDRGTLWESNGDGTYSTQDIPRPEGCGTTVTLKLKTNLTEKQNDGNERVQDFTDEWTLKSLIKKYSDFVSWPIRMVVEKSSVNEETKQTETAHEEQTLNSQKAIWLKAPGEVTDEEYSEFYQHLTHDWQKPAKHVRFKAEGSTEFITLFYIPSKKPFNYQTKEYGYGLNLYIKRVFIMENCKDLLPPYLRFVKGMVDSSDLSLNVSRELLQQDRVMLQIKKSLTTKITSTLSDWMNKERDVYEKFWSEFGATLKEVVPVDPSQTEKFQDLFLFRSSHAENKMTSLKEYVARMPADQKDIYYITGERIELVQNSPYLEALKEKKYEVFFLVDPIDEWVVQGLRQYQGKNLLSISQEGLSLDSEVEKAEKETQRQAQTERFAPLLEKMKAALSAEVKDVVISRRLTSTPTCLVTGENEMSSHMQKILSQMGEGLEKTALRVLEINPNHPIFEDMLNADDEKVKTWSEILFNQAYLAEGQAVPNPARFTQLVTELMMGSKSSSANQ